MSWRLVAVLVVGALLALAACGSGGGASSRSRAEPSTAPRARRPPPARVESPPATSAAPGASVCRQTDDPGAVAVTDRRTSRSSRPTIEAKVGRGRSPSPTPASSHTTRRRRRRAARRATLETGESDGLVFSAPGTYAFDCTVHRWMTGTFTIAAVRPEPDGSGPLGEEERGARRQVDEDRRRAARPRRTRPGTARGSRGPCPGTARRAGRRR